MNLDMRLKYALANMKTRCRNPKSEKYKHYGARGIEVCEEWDTLANFEAWALSSGYSHDLQIDRIDNDKGYSPDNCRWVSGLENARNKQRTVRINGERIDEIASRIGVKPNTIYERWRKGAPLEKVCNPHLWTPAPLWLECKERGIRYSTVAHRIRAGWSEEKALNTPIRKKRKNGLK